MSDLVYGYVSNDIFILEGEYRAIKETPRALLVQQDGEEPFWVPESQIHEDSEVYAEGTEGTLIVTLWFARQREWCD